MEQHPIWKGKWTVLLAATGSAVGLGNIWLFPYKVGEYGGSAFVLVYLAGVLIMGVPLMISEITIGRFTRMSPFNAVTKLSENSRVPGAWRLLGFIPHIGSCTILTFYAVIAGWALLYMVHMATGGVFGSIQVAEESAAAFSRLQADPLTMIFYHTLFMAATIFIVAKGVIAGLEKSINWMMPLLFVMVICLLIYSMFSGQFMRSLEFLFTPDWSKINGESVSFAIGQAFFSLSLGMGSIITYGAYMAKEGDIAKTGTAVSLLDMLLALCMGLVVFPVVFSFGLEPNSGPGLIFESMPLAFGSLPLGNLFGTVFFALVAVAALSSSISLLEPTVALLEERTSLKRWKIAALVGGAIWLAGFSVVLSFNVWQDVHILPGKNIFDTLDYIVSNIMLPLGGLVTALWMGWLMKPSDARNELGLGPQWFGVLHTMVRYVSPVLLFLVLFTSLGIIQF